MRTAITRERSLRRALLFLGTASTLTDGCFQQVNDAASRGRDGGTTASHDLITRIVPSTDPIALDPADESSVTTDACEKTRRDKTEILTAFCAACHSGNAAVGLPPWNFVLDDSRLVKEVWTREGQVAQRFVIPGDPEHSALYQRMAIAGDMPPQPTDLGSHRNPTPSLSDISIVREWILRCLGAPAPVSGSGGAGSGGTPGSGGRAGGGGVGGTDGGSMPGTGGAASGDGGAAGTTAGSGGTGGMSGAPGATGGSTADGGASDGRGTGTGGAGTSDAGAADATSGTGGSSAADAGSDASDAGTRRACDADVTAGGSCVAHTSSCMLASKTCSCVLSNGKHSWSCR